MGQLAIRGGALLVGALYGIGSAAMMVYTGMMRVAEGFYGLLSMIPKFGDAYKGLYAESKTAADGAWAKTKEYSDKSGELVQAAFASKTVIAKATRKQQDDETEHFKAAKGVESAVLKSAMDKAKNIYETAASAAKEAYDKIASAADFALRKEILLGSNVLASELAAIKIKQDARATELQTDLAARKVENNAEMTAIKASTELAAIKIAKLSDLDSKYVLDKQKLQADAAKDEQKLAQDNALKLIEIQQTTFFGGVEKGYKDIINDYSNVGKSMAEVTKKSFDGMADALTTFVTTGKMDFKSLADSIIADLIRIFIREQMSSIFGSSGIIGKLFGGVSGLVGGGAGGEMGLGGWTGSVAHAGGIIGYDSFPMRDVSPVLFDNAPRFHSGLSYDEFPAILQRGEQVIPRNKVTNNQKSTTNNSKEDSTTNYNIFITANDSKSFVDMCNKNPAGIIGPIMASLRENKIRPEMKRLLQ
jgi:phage-related minor tail protein